MKLTENFSLREFACPCGCKGEQDPEVAARLRRLCERRLQPIRDALGVPLRIHSGFRCEAYNARCGGAKRSQHMLGTAADVWSPDADVDAIYGAALAVAMGLKGGGIKGYVRTDGRRSFCHVDDRGGVWWAGVSR